jgi:hypothetical protein
MGAMIPEADRQWAGLMRQEACARMTYLLPPGTILAMPTTPFPAPKCGLSLAAQNPLRERILCLCAHGGLTGVPQVSIPGAKLDDAPIGLSIMGGHGTDAARYAMHEHGYGFDAIHQHRVARLPGPGIKEKRLRLEILTLGRDFATVNLEFKVRNRELIGRQGQSWVRFPDLGWKVVSAHVSTTDGQPLW